MLCFNIQFLRWSGNEPAIVCVHAKLLQLWPVLCNLMGCSPPVSSFHGILQARIVEWVAMPSSRGSSDPGIEPPSLMSPALAGRVLNTSTTWEAPVCHCCCSVAQLCPTLCNPRDCSMPGFPVPRCLLEFTQILCPLSQWCHPTIHLLPSPFPPALNLSQHQGLFQWVGSLHQVAEVLEFQLQHQSFQWIFRADFL